MQPTTALLPIRFAITSETIGKQQRQYDVSLGRNNFLPPTGDGEGIRSIFQANLDPFVSDILHEAWQQEGDIQVPLDKLKTLLFIQIATGWRHYGDHHRANVDRKYSGSLFRLDQLLEHWQFDGTPFGSLLDRTIDLGSFGEAFDAVRAELPLTTWGVHGIEAMIRGSMKHGWLAHRDWIVLAAS